MENLKGENMNKVYYIDCDDEYIQNNKKFLKDFNVIKIENEDIEKIKSEIKNNNKLTEENKLYKDYFRLYYIYKNGGLLLDGNFEIYKSLDNFFKNDVFLGFYDDKKIATNIIWSIKKENKYIKQVLVEIETNNYQNITEIFSKIFNKDFTNNYNTLVNIDNSLYIYPYDYFYPLDYTACGKDITENLKTIFYETKILPKKQLKKIKYVKKLGLSGYRYIVIRLRTIRSKLGYKKYILEQKIKSKRNDKQSYQKQIQVALDALDNYKDADYIIFHNPTWMGVTSATKELFTNLVPLQEIYSEKEAILIANKIKSLNIKQVIFSAFCFGWDMLAVELKRNIKDIKVKVFWHGSNSQVIDPIDSINWKTNMLALDLHRAGIIDVFATCKKSIINFYKSQGYTTTFIDNTVRFSEELKENIKSKLKKDSNDKKIKIGLYAAGNYWRKNMYNQIAGASLINNAVLDLIPLSYDAKVFARKCNLEITGLEKGIKREELLARMAQNDINLYITFSECSPMLPLESMEMGAICLLGDNNHYFKGSELEKYLVVSREDDVICIANKIKYALENKEKILELYNQWKEKHDIESTRSVEKFLSM